MSIEKKLREELHQAAEAMSCPPELQARIKMSYQDYNNQQKGSFYMKKRILAGIIALAVLVPSGLFAASYLTDDLFGSVTVIEEKGGSVEGYEEIEEMLQAAKGKLSEDEFEDFMALMKQMAQLKLKMTDENAIRHEDRLTAEEQVQFQQLGEKLLPYFEKIQ